MRNCTFLVILFIIALVIPGCGGGSGSDGAWYSGGGDSGGTTTTSPTISSCSLSSQQFTPGSVCTVQGTNFGDTRSTKDGGASNIYLYYNSGASYIIVPSANIVSWSATSITFIIPTTAQAGTQYIISIVRVVNGTTYSSGTTSTSANTVTPSTPQNVPTITNISPSSGITAGSTSITITGTNFGSSQATGSYVGFTLNGVIAVALSVTSWGNNQIVVVVPSGTPTGSVSVYVQTATGGSSASSTIVVSGSSSGPNISSISPASASQGGSITISGSGFGSSATTSYVMIGSVQAAISSWGDNAIVCTVPLSVSPGSRNVTVTTSAGTSAAYVITVVAASGAPYITSISPTTVNQTSSISITGGNFGTQGSNYVMVGSVAGSVTYWSSNLITVTISTSMTQGSNAVYVNVGGISSNTSTITIVSATAPTISSLSPTSVTQGAGTTLTIYGTNFGSAGATSYVTIGGYTATITSWGVNTIVVTVPTSVAAGSATVYVIVAGVSTNAAALTVTSTSTPSISGISGTTAGGTCTISGSGFGSTTGTVTIGGVTATVTGWGTTAVYCTFPYTCAPTGTLTLTASTGTASTTYTRTYAWGAATQLDNNGTGVDNGSLLFDTRATNQGDCIAVWPETIGANKGLFTKRLSSSAWGALVRVDDALVAGTVLKFSAAMRKDGSQYMFVYEKTANNINYAVYAPATDTWGRFDAGADRIDSAGQPLKTASQMYVSYASDGTAVCTYTSEPAAGTYSIVASKWVSPAWTEKGTGVVSITAANAATGSSIFMFDSTTKGMCCFFDGVNGRVMGSTYDATALWAAAWGAPANVSAVAATTKIGLAVDNASPGNFISVYRQAGRVYENFYSAVAPIGWVGPIVYDAGAGGAGDYPGAAFDSANIAYLIFSNGATGTYVIRRTAGAAGALEATLKRIDDDTVFANQITSITFDPTGTYGFAAYFKTDAGGTWNLGVRKYVVSTAAWDATPTALLSTSATVDKNLIPLAAGVSSNAEAGWFDGGKFYVRNYR